MKEKWDRVLVSKLVPFQRNGWIGVWDALKAALTGDPRFCVPRPITFSVYVKDIKEGLCCWGAQIEVEPPKED